MIAVTRLDGRQVLINADLIESVEQTPDTIISFSSGHKLIVRDQPADLSERVIAYRHRVLTGQATPAVPPASPAQPGQVDGA